MQFFIRRKGFYQFGVYFYGYAQSANPHFNNPNNALLIKFQERKVTRVPGGTSSVTQLLPPMVAPLPMVMSPRMVALA